MKDLFLLNPDIIFLNHGAFGAAPKAVMEEYQNWQERLERQPVQFFVREMLDEFKKARQALGDCLNADPDDLVYIPNATYGVNILARSLELNPGDEILTTDHEYGACENAWEFSARRNGARLVRQAIGLPLGSPKAVAEQFWRGVTPRTKVIFISHISSPTAMRMPVEIICRKARQAGILAVIDGAHAPGQIPVDIKAIDPDFYTGNCHKWMLSPKGAGFLYTRGEQQDLVEPLVVSWGWGENSPFSSGSRYLDYFEWSGTNDPSAYLSVPAAIRFQEEHNWADVGRRCQEMLSECLNTLEGITGLDSAYSREAEPFKQMAIVRIPPIRDLEEFQDRLLKHYRIEVPCIEWNGQHFLRISIQGYNNEGDVEALVGALSELLPQYAA